LTALQTFRKISIGFVNRKLHFYFLFGIFFGIYYWLFAVRSDVHFTISNQISENLILGTIVVTYFSLTGISLGLLESKAKYTALGWLSGCAILPFIKLSKDLEVHNLHYALSAPFVSSTSLAFCGSFWAAWANGLDHTSKKVQKAKNQNEKRSKLLLFFTSQGRNNISYLAKLALISYVLSVLQAPVNTYTFKAKHVATFPQFLTLFAITLAYFQLPFIKKKQRLRIKSKPLARCAAEYKALQKEFKDGWYEANDEKFIAKITALDNKWRAKVIKRQKYIKIRKTILTIETEQQFNKLIDSQSMKCRNLIDIKKKRQEAALIKIAEEAAMAKANNAINAATRALAKRDKDARRALNDERLRLGLTKTRIPKDADDFEEVCAEWMRKTGYPDAKRTSKGPDGGVDVMSENAVAQAKFYSSKKVTAEEVRALVGSRVASNKKTAIFFAYSLGYTDEALQVAKATKTLLYVLDVDNRIFKKVY